MNKEEYNNFVNLLAKTKEAAIKKAEIKDNAFSSFNGIWEHKGTIKVGFTVQTGIGLLNENITLHETDF